MDDQQTAANSLADKPVEKPILPPEHEPLIDENPAADAKARLRAFEDEHLGLDTPRIGDKIERGIGAPIRHLSPELQAEHAALERLIDAEQKLAAAAGHLAAADVHHEEAKAHVEHAAAAVDGKPPEEADGH